MSKYTEQELVRRKKLDFYKENNVKAFKNADDLKELSYSDDITKKYQEYTREELEEKAFPVNLSGRIMTMRGPFIVIQDYHGRMQVYFNKKENVELAKIVETFDLGDIIYVEGVVMKTHTDQVSVRSHNIEL
ncbi:lysine--tRNA ligase, partial [Mycoplasmopsis pullorum]